MGCRCLGSGTFGPLDSRQGPPNDSLLALVTHTVADQFRPPQLFHLKEILKSLTSGIPLPQQVTLLGRVAERQLQLPCPPSYWPPGTASWPAKWWAYSLPAPPTLGLLLWQLLPACPFRLLQVRSRHQSL